jgi:hypothetical protein
MKSDLLDLDEVEVSVVSRPMPLNAIANWCKQFRKRWAAKNTEEWCAGRTAFYVYHGDGAVNPYQIDSDSYERWQIGFEASREIYDSW